mmetsp:Transcript_3796/g.10084  ORF Transcript_3796/g.10084 Transcript_3796/m.10084 type:complete len:270 (+) Transcript_3796:279-1088(+)
MAVLVLKVAHEGARLHLGEPGCLLSSANQAVPQPVILLRRRVRSIRLLVLGLEEEERLLAAALAQVIDAALEVRPVAVHGVDEGRRLAGRDDAAVAGLHDDLLHLGHGLDALLAHLSLLEHPLYLVTILQRTTDHGLVAIREGLRDAVGNLDLVWFAVPPQEADELVLRVRVGAHEGAVEDELADVPRDVFGLLALLHGQDHPAEGDEEPEEARRPQDPEDPRGLGQLLLRPRVVGASCAPVGDLQGNAHPATDDQGKVKHVKAVPEVP